MYPIMKNITKILAVVAAGSLFTVACTKNFEQLNTHPSDLNPEDMNSVERVGTLLPAMIYLLQPQHENNSQMTDQLVYGQVGGYYAAPNPFSNHGGADHQVASFNPQNSMYQSPYVDKVAAFYSNYFKVVEETNGEGPVALISQVLRVAIMHKVADTYGPIPYSKIGGGEFEVEYDGLAELYPRFIDDLSKAITSLEGYSGTSEALADYDIMYHGDFAKWRRFANSVKFRLALRMSSMDEDFAKTAMEEAMANGMILENNDNGMLPTNDNPVYKAAISWGDLVVNATITTYMNGYYDLRRQYYFNRDDWGDYAGMRLGYFPGQHPPFSTPKLTQTSPLPVYYAAESYFLMAEAAARGLISGDAVSYYNAGIRISHDQWGAALSNYMDQPGGTFNYNDSLCDNATLEAPAVTMSASDDLETKLQKILTQKYIALYPMGLESWCDFRRTGYPEMITTQHLAGTEVNATRMMRRLKYPDSERYNNPANWQKAIDTWFGGEDSFGKDLDWAKKD